MPKMSEGKVKQWYRDLRTERRTMITTDVYYKMHRMLNADPKQTTRESVISHNPPPWQRASLHHCQNHGGN